MFAAPAMPLPAFDPAAAAAAFMINPVAAAAAATFAAAATMAEQQAAQSQQPQLAQSQQLEESMADAASFPVAAAPTLAATPGGPPKVASALTSHLSDMAGPADSEMFGEYARLLPALPCVPACCVLSLVECRATP
jgi:hypothetical protein